MPSPVIYRFPDSRPTLWWSRGNLLSLLRTLYRARGIAPTGLGFRVLMTLLMILISTTLSQTFPLAGLAATVTTAVYWLGITGLIILTLTEDPFKAGLGLLTAFTGFGIFYSTLETSLLLTGLWGSMNLLIALAIGYLTVVKGAAQEEEL